MVSKLRSEIKLFLFVSSSCSVSSNKQFFSGSVFLPPQSSSHVHCTRVPHMAVHDQHRRCADRRGAHYRCSHHHLSNHNQSRNSPTADRFRSANAKIFQLPHVDPHHTLSLSLSLSLSVDLRYLKVLDGLVIVMGLKISAVSSELT